MHLKKGPGEEEDEPPSDSPRERRAHTVLGNSPVSDHVQHCAKLGRLAKSAGCHAIESVEQARDAVQDCAHLWVALHKVEGQGGQENTRIA